MLEGKVADGMKLYQACGHQQNSNQVSVLNGSTAELLRKKRPKLTQ